MKLMSIDNKVVGEWALEVRYSFNVIPFIHVDELIEFHSHRAIRRMKT